MAGYSIRLEGDVSGLLRKLRGYENLDKKRLNTVLAAAMRESTLERFKQEKGPDGKRWKSSIRAVTTGGKTLVLTAQLRNSIKTYADAKGFAVGTNARHAATHQFGGPGRGAEIPPLHHPGGPGEEPGEPHRRGDLRPGGHLPQRLQNLLQGPRGSAEKTEKGLRPGDLLRRDHRRLHRRRRGGHVRAVPGEPGPGHLCGRQLRPPGGRGRRLGGQGRFHSQGAGRRAGTRHLPRRRLQGRRLRARLRPGG
ncbi:MAG: hypothetical protein HFF17_01200 [Oscillospiraceae bacterium]|nr:hypothetical protein [Oscillospiraceae bacterium]